MTRLQSYQGPHNRVYNRRLGAWTAQWTLTMTDGSKHTVHSVNVEGGISVKLRTANNKLVGGNRVFSSADDAIRSVGNWITRCEHGVRGTEDCTACLEAEEAEAARREAYQTDMDLLAEADNDRWASDRDARIPAYAR